MDLGLLGMSLIMFGLGFWMALFPEGHSRRAETRMAAGDDRHFEEQRAYRVYPSLRDPKIIRRNGIAIIALSGVGAALALWLV